MKRREKTLKRENLEQDAWKKKCSEEKEPERRKDSAKRCPTEMPVVGREKTIV